MLLHAAKLAQAVSLPAGRAHKKFYQTEMVKACCDHVPGGRAHKLPFHRQGGNATDNRPLSPVLNTRFCAGQQPLRLGCRHTEQLPTAAPALRRYAAPVWGAASAVHFPNLVRVGMRRRRTLPAHMHPPEASLSRRHSGGGARMQTELATAGGQAHDPG